MKNIRRTCCLILLGVCLIFISSSFKVYADDRNVLNANDDSGNMTVDLGNDSSFCIELNNILPGEHYKDKIIVKNNHIYPYDLYFSISPKAELNKKSLELLKYINIEIKYKNKIIYKGAANGEALNDIVFIGTAYPKTEENIDIYIDISKDMDSSFSNLETFDIFDFYSLKHYENSKNVTYNKLIANNDTNELNPKTGDDFKFNSYLVCIIICLVVLVILNLKTKRKKL